MKDVREISVKPNSTNLAFWQNNLIVILPSQFDGGFGWSFTMLKLVMQSKELHMARMDILFMFKWAI